MSRVEIFLPISRSEHLQALFSSLEHMSCDASKTSLLAYVDGDHGLFEAVQPFVEHSKFAERRSAHRPQAGVQKREFDVDSRRQRIAAIKNESRALIGQCDYVLSIEDDTIVPPHTLEHLLEDYSLYPHAGFIEGVELGRWGISMVGAWLADDVYEPTRLVTAKPGDNPNIRRFFVEPVDAGGFYAYLTKRKTYVEHEYKPFLGNVAGPDVDFGISLRRQGYKNYIDWNILCEHRLKNGEALTVVNHDVIERVELAKAHGHWKQKIL